MVHSCKIYVFDRFDIGLYANRQIPLAQCLPNLIQTPNCGIPIVLPKQPGAAFKGKYQSYQRSIDLPRILDHQNQVSVSILMLLEG